MEKNIQRTSKMEWVNEKKNTRIQLHLHLSNVYVAEMRFFNSHSQITAIFVLFHLILHAKLSIRLNYIQSNKWLFLANFGYYNSFD